LSGKDSFPPPAFPSIMVVSTWGRCRWIALDHAFPLIPLSSRPSYGRSSRPRSGRYPFRRIRVLLRRSRRHSSIHAIARTTTLPGR
jgi:hypothetical protein